VRHAKSEHPVVIADQTHVLVVWKPPGWHVTVGRLFEGSFSLETSASENLAGHNDCAMHQWIQEHLGGGCAVTQSAEASHGIAHRLDRFTSGPLLCSKTFRGYYSSLLQFVSRRVQKEYVCMCSGFLHRLPRMIETELRAVRKADGSKYSEAVDSGRQACTELLAVSHFHGPDGEALSLVEVSLHTGRTHQIRIHLSSEGHPLVGDAMYGGTEVNGCPRIFLHSRRLALDIGDGPLDVNIPLPKDLRRTLGCLTPTNAESCTAVARCC